MDPSIPGPVDFLKQGGELGALMRAKDWSTTPLGPPETWPQSLRTTVSLCLASNVPINIIWGPSHTQLYNDGYREGCGDAHPRALGEDYRVTWASAWPVIGGSFESALMGETMFVENQRMFLKRHPAGGLEETFFTFSHSPIRDESGGIGGLFHPVTETTATILAERRTRALRDLGTSLGLAQDEADVARRTAEVLSNYESDLPFLLFYQREATTGRYKLVACHGIERDLPASPAEITGDSNSPFPFQDVLQSGKIVAVGSIAADAWGDSCGPYPEPPNEAFLLPVLVPGIARAPAIVVAGASPRLRMNDAYRGFYQLLNVTIANALATVRAREDERRRADWVAESKAQMADLARTRRPGPYEGEFLCKDGRRAWMLFTGQDLDDGTIVEFAIDTDRKRAGTALVESEAKLEAALSSMPEVVLITDADGTPIHINKAFNPFHRFTDEQQASMGLAAFQTVFEFFTEAGEAIPFEQWPVSRALRGETCESIVIRLRRQDTGESWYGSYNAAPIRENARIVGAVVTIRDITERLRTQETLRQELAAREAAQVMASRMQALGQLAGGIAHDFNNVLQAIEGATTLIKHRVGDEAATRRLAQLAQDAVKRGASVTRRLLTFSGRGQLRTEALDALDVLRGIGEILAHTLEANVEIHIDHGSNALPLHTDKGQLETVLVNLATNARDAMPEGGALTILAESAIIVASGPTQPDELVPGRYVRFTVTDTGSGMDGATLARAAEPFFTTKPPGKGTGLGLAMAKGFSEQSGGAMNIASSMGGGTTVTLWLPQAGPNGLSTTPMPGDAVVTRSATGNGAKPVRVLVVDDEEPVRKILTDYLEYEGLEVVTAANAAEALALLGAGQTVDALVTDLSMPGVSGLELIRSVQKRLPGLPAVLLTGYAAEDSTAALSGSVDGAFSLMRKPVDAQDLVDRVQTLVMAGGERVP
jgi:PAS domain S-box-containing protein